MIQQATIQVLRDMVAVIQTQQPKTGLIEVVRNEERLFTGRIVAIGTGVLSPQGVEVPLAVKIGDEVAFDKMSAYPIEHKGVKYWIMNELSIKCILLQG